MSKVVDIYDRERKAAKCLGMTLRAFLDRKALLLRQAEGMRKRIRYGKLALSFRVKLQAVNPVFFDEPQSQPHAVDETPHVVNETPQSQPHAVDETATYKFYRAKQG